MYYVYIIRSISFPKQLYTGFSSDLKKRLSDHNEGKSQHTSKYIPWEIIFYSSFRDESSARNFEKYLKSASGIAFRNKRLIQLQ